MRSFVLCAAFLLLGPLAAQEPTELDSLKDQLKELQGKVAEAREKGQSDEAEKLKQKADELKDQIAKARDAEKRRSRDRRGRGEGDGKGRSDADTARSMDLIEKVAHLRREAIRAKREGNLDKAKASWAEADLLDQELRLEGEPSEKHDENRATLEFRGKGQGLREQGEAIARDGEKMAEDLRRQAEELKAQAQALPRDGDQHDEAREKLEEKARKLKDKAEQVAQEHKEKAQALLRDAERLSRENGGPNRVARVKVAPRAAVAPRAVVRTGKSSDRQQEDLRSEIDRLRKEVQELRDLLNRSLQERSERDPKNRNFR